MKRRIVALACAGVLAAGCSSPMDQLAHEATATTTQAKPTPTKVYTADDVFIETLKTFGLDDADARRDDYIDLAKKVCHAYDIGASDVEIAAAMMQGGLTKYDAGVIIGAAVGSYCTEYSTNN